MCEDAGHQNLMSVQSTFGYNRICVINFVTDFWFKHKLRIYLSNIEKSPTPQPPGPQREHNQLVLSLQMNDSASSTSTDSKANIFLNIFLRPWCA